MQTHAGPWALILGAGVASELELEATAQAASWGYDRPRGSR